jgi:3-hydroxy-9,10-secoandrosta-1,3,5(10)-triene-9,17-dione monooxygenase
VARAKAIVPELKRLSVIAEQQRRLTKEGVALMKEKHLGRVLQPKMCSGYAMSMRSHVDVIAAIAEGCSATAWVFGVGHAHSWMMGHFPPEAQKEVYGGNPDALIAAVIGPRGRGVKRPDGSVLLNGVWPFASGCEVADWLFFGSEIFNEAGEKIDEADLLVHPSQVEIKDDWYVAGLQGTGSATVVIKDLVVPPHRYLSLPPWLESELPTFHQKGDDWLTQAQAIPVLGLCISTAALGMGRAALAEFRRVVPGKKIIYTDHISDDWIPTQTALGHAAAMIHAAGLVLYQAADDIDDYARRGEKMPMELRARIRMDCSYAVRTLLEAVDKLFIGSGASGLSLKGTMQKFARDLHAVNMHALLLFDTSAEIYGRVLLGKGSNSPIV